MKRNLSGIYYRVKRDGKFENICFEDLSRDEQTGILDDYTEDALKALALQLAEVISEIGEEFDIISEGY